MTLFLFQICCLFTNLTFAQCNIDESIQETVALYASKSDTTELKQLVEQLSNCPDLQDSLGYAYHVLAKTYYKIEGKLKSAIHYAQKAAATREKSHVPSSDIAVSNYNLALFLKENNEFEQSNQHFAIAAKLYELAGDTTIIWLISESHKNMSENSRKLGELEEALNYARIGIQYAKQTKAPNILIGNYIEYANALNEMQAYLPESNKRFSTEFSKAENQLIESRKICQEILQDYPKDLDWLNLNSLVDLTLGNTYLHQKEYQEALSYYQSSLRFTSRYKGLIYNNLGVVYKYFKDYKQSIAILEEAKSIQKSIGNIPLYRFCLDNLGDIYKLKGEYERALGYYDEAINSISPNLTPEIATKELSEQIIYKQDLYRYLKGKAGCLREYAQTKETESEQHVLLKEALKNYLINSKLLDALKLELSSDLAYISWQSTSKRLYEEALEVCFLLNDKESAHYFMEKSKGSLLLKALWEVDVITLIGEEAVAKRMELVKDLQYAQKLIDIESDSIKKLQRRQDFLTKQKELADFYDNLAQQYPDHFQFYYASEVISLPEVQQTLLNDSTQIVHYFEGQKSFYLLSISNQVVSLQKIDRTSDLNDLIDDFSRPFKEATQRNRFEEDPSAYAKLAYEMYEQLYAPAWQNPETLSSQVIIIPDGRLNYVPFDALLTQKSDALSFSTLPYLLKEQHISQAFSTTILNLQYEKTGIDKGDIRGVSFAPFLGISPQSNDCSGKLPMLENSVEGFSLIPGRQYENEAASLDKFSQYASNAQLIHLATHADSKGCNSEEPYIMFADNNLHLSELYSTRLQAAPLVVLRGCYTADGAFQEGEGVFNFIRGFTYAGAVNVVASLWDAHEETSGLITREFYQNLNRGHSIAKALTIAKRSYLISDHEASFYQKSPFYWANFVAMGFDKQVDIGNVSNKKSSNFFLLGMFLIALGGLGLWRLNKRKNY